MATNLKRTDLGPLTTVFVPPSACSTLLVESSSGSGYLSWGETCLPSPLALGNNPKCEPTAFAEILANRNEYVTAIAFYSGSLCPQGWDKACTVSRVSGEALQSSATLNPASSAIWDLLKAGETAVRCCPRSWQCSKGDPHFCAPPVPTKETTYTGTSYNSNCALVTNTATFSSGVAIGAAYAVQLIIAGPSESASAAGSTSSGRSSSGGLSTGAKAAIGVVVPVVVLLALGALVFFLRRRKKRGAEAHNEQRDNIRAPETAQVGAVSGVAGNAGGTGQLAELDTSSRTRLPPELESVPSPSATAGASEVSAGPRSPSSPNGAAERVRSNTMSNVSEAPEDNLATSLPASTEVTSNGLGQGSTAGDTAQDHETDHLLSPAGGVAIPPQIAETSSSGVGEIGSDGTLEQLQAEQARIESEIARHHELSRLRSEQDEIQRRIREIQEQS